jgi:hypothetical protein
MKCTWRTDRDEILLGVMKKRVGRGGGRGTGKLRGAVRMLGASLRMKNVTARPHVLTGPKDGSGTVVYQSNWNIRLTIAFLPCYYRNLSCVKEVAGEMVTS